MEKINNEQIKEMITKHADTVHAISRKLQNGKNTWKDGRPEHNKFQRVDATGIRQGRRPLTT